MSNDNQAIEKVEEKQDKKTAMVKQANKQGNLAGLKPTHIGAVLEQMIPTIEKTLPKHLTPDRMIQMVTSVLTKNPKLKECTLPSLFGAVTQASVLGFPPVDALGYCYFVPYGKDVQFQIGYKGYIDLARRSGEISDIWAEVVYSTDEFEVEQGLDRHLTHKPGNAVKEDKNITHIYACAKFKDDTKTFVVLTRGDIELLRKRSPMQKDTPSGAWKTDYPAMAKAKALKQLAKMLPLSIDAIQNMASDEQIISPDNFNMNGYNAEDANFDHYEVSEIDESTGEFKTDDQKSIMDGIEEEAKK